MVGVVGGQVGDGAGIPGEVGVAGVLDPGFDLAHGPVDAGHDLVPLGGVEAVEGFLVVGDRRAGLFAAHFGQGAGVVEEQVMREHADGVVSVGVQLAGGISRHPARLLRGEPGDGGVERGKPLGLVVGVVQLLKQRAAQGNGRGGFWLGGAGWRLGKRRGGEQREQERQEKRSAEHASYCAIRVEARGRAPEVWHACAGLLLPASIQRLVTSTISIKLKASPS